MARGGKEKLTAAELIEAAERFGGNISAVARYLNVSRTTVYRYIQQYVTVEEAFDNEKEVTLDYAEGTLIQFMEGRRVVKIDGQRREQVVEERHQLDAIKWFLATQGKERGYTKRVEQTGKDGKDLSQPQVHYYLPEVDETQMPEEDWERIEEIKAAQKNGHEE